MSELTALGRCPTCGSPRHRYAVCTCGCPVWRHQFNRKGARTSCYGCKCRAFTEATS